MTDLQLYIAVGIPTLAVLLGFLLNAIQFSSLNGRFNSIDARLGSLETRFDARFNNLESKFDTLTGKVVDIDNHVTRIEAKLGIT